MKPLYRICAFALAALALAGCVDNKTFKESDFLETNPDGDICLSEGGRNIMTYDSRVHQSGFNDTSNEFRVSDDTMTEYFVIRLRTMPSSVGETISADVEWNVSGEAGGGQYAMKVLRLDQESGKIWLWCQEAGLGAVVRDIR